MSDSYSFNDELYTYADYERFGEDERCELIEGRRYPLPRVPKLAHQKLVLDLVSQLLECRAAAKCKVMAAPFDVRLPIGDQRDGEIRSVVQPDICVISDRSKLDEKGCRGAPDVVIEIISHDSEKVDYVQKAKLYEKHRVQEYWTIHPIDKAVTIRVLMPPGIYVKRVLEAGGRIALTAVRGMEVDFDRIAL